MPGGSPLLSGGRATTVGRSERLGEREREIEIVAYHGVLLIKHDNWVVDNFN